MNRGDQIAKAVLLLLGVVMLDQYRRGQLGDWLRAKLTNAGPDTAGVGRGPAFGSATEGLDGVARRALAGGTSPAAPGSLRDVAGGALRTAEPPAMATIPAPVVAPPERPRAVVPRLPVGGLGLPSGGWS